MKQIIAIWLTLEAAAPLQYVAVKSTKIKTPLILCQISLMFAVICVVLFGIRSGSSDDSGLGCDGLLLLLKIIKLRFFGCVV